jgi:hypothetical protein
MAEEWWRGEIYSHLHAHSGGRKGEPHAQHDCHVGGQAELHADDCCYARAEQHLRRAQREDVLGHGHQPLEAQLQPDVEQQEDHAELRQVLHAVHVLDDAQAVRAQQQAADEKA